MLRVAEQASRSDTGRQRTANEDSYFARAPIFAVADGMGGAQAGEVASRIAAESFEPLERSDESAEIYLRTIAEAANERIHSLAEHDTSRLGMGTTLTAAMVEGDEVSLAHVGDSRAYLFRDGELKLLTSDHSLVEELRRQGRLTDEQALEHPQRSIITRALGPEREVEIDTMTYRARPDDVFVLCSDGLTTMVNDDRIAAALSEESDLDAAVRRLVGEANDSGGRDNITIVAFRLTEGAPVTVDEQPTLVGPTAADAGLTPEAVAAEAEPATAAPRVGRPRPTPARARRSRLRTGVKIAVALLVVAGIGAGAVYGARQIYFLGADEGGRLALYRGLPYELPFDVDLYSEVHSVPVQVASVPADRRGSVTDHELRSRSDAISLLEDLQASAAEAQATQREAEQRERARARRERRGPSAGGAGGDSREAGLSGRKSQGAGSRDGSRERDGSGNRR